MGGWQGGHGGVAKESTGVWQRTLRKQGGILEANFWRTLGGVRRDWKRACAVVCGLHGETWAAINTRRIQEGWTFLVMS